MPNGAGKLNVPSPCTPCKAVTVGLYLPNGSGGGEAVPLKETTVRVRLLLHKKTLARSEALAEKLGLRDPHELMAMALGLGLVVLEAATGAVSQSPGVMSAATQEANAQLLKEFAPLMGGDDEKA